MDIEQRFLPYVQKSDGCWLWTGAKSSSGYGHLTVQRKTVKAHRLSYEMYVRDLCEGECVLHRCDTPLCVNPLHLYAGTKKDNASDREARNRSNHAVGTRHGCTTHPGLRAGSRNGRAKLNETAVADLRSQFKQGTRKADLARRYGISKTAVGDIVSGKLWPEVGR